VQPTGDNVEVSFAIVLADPGEWPTAGIFLGLAFAVAVAGVIALGVWVLRGDSLNRRAETHTVVETEREQLSPSEGQLQEAGSARERAEADGASSTAS
jgi:ribosomal protein S3